MIKVCHVITTIDLGGAEKQLLLLSSYQVKMGYEVEVMYLKGKPVLLEDFVKSGVKVIENFANKSIFLQFVSLVQKGYRNKNLVFHAHLPRSELLCALALPKKSFVITRHNSEPFLPEGNSHISRLLSRYVIYNAFASIFISHAAKLFSEGNRESLASDLKFVVYYGLQDVIPIENKAKIINADFIEIGTVSRLVPQKNLFFLLDIAAELKNQNLFNFKINILGSGHLKEELISYGERLGINKILQWQEPTLDVATFYRNQDIFVLTSFYEGFGLVLLEAMKFQIPILASNTSAIPEVLGTNHPGLTSSSDPKYWAAKIVSLVRDKKQSLQYLQCQRERLNRFSIDKTYFAHHDVYSKVIERFSRDI